jgi:hypothetical protein
MKKNKLISLGFITVTAVFASFFGGSFSYALFYASLAVPFTCYIYLLFVFIRLKIYQSIDSKVVVKGDKIGYKYTLSNETIIHFANVKTEFISDYSRVDSEGLMREISLAPNQKSENITELTCLYRGEYRVGVKSVVMRDYLGIFKIRRQYPSTMNIRVYPRVVKLTSLAALNFGGDVKSLPFTYRQGQEIDTQTRPFTFGDSIQSINWKISAKSGLNELHVRNRVESPKEKIVLYIDTSPIKGSKKIQNEDKILEITLAIADFYLNKKIETEIIYYSDELNRVSINSRENFAQFYDSCLNLTFMSDMSDISKNYFDRITADSSIMILITADIKFINTAHIYNYIIITGNHKSSELSAIRENLGKTVLIHIPEDSDINKILDMNYGF